MKLREALQVQAPSLALQRSAADEIARLDAEVTRLDNLADAYRTIAIKIGEAALNRPLVVQVVDNAKGLDLG